MSAPHTAGSSRSTPNYSNIFRFPINRTFTLKTTFFMKKTTLRKISLSLAGTLLAATGLLTSCQTSDYAMDELTPTELDTRAADGAFMPGSIPEELVIDTENPDDTFTIPSERLASCVGGGAIRYVWHIKTARGWSEIPDSNVASLTTQLTMEFATQYRREAITGRYYEYSNICTVYNKAFFDGGAITDSIVLNYGSFDDGYEIRSLRAGTITSSGYRWEIDKGAGWEEYPGSDAELIFYYEAPYRHETKYRRSVVTSFGTAYSNICTIINYAFGDDPQAGSDPETHAVKIGPFAGDFSQSFLFDTRGDYFSDHDRATGYGNDAYITLTLDRPTLLEFITGASPMRVFTMIWSERDEKYLYSDHTSNAYTAVPGHPIPTFDSYEPYPGIIRLELNPGEYRIQVQGSKATNSGAVNGVISISLRGFTGPVITVPSLTL